jgi:pimeloyl-ACP methyl ester carboxylesterase
MGLKCLAVLQSRFSYQIIICTSLFFLVTACTENGTPPQLDAYVYPSVPASTRCETGVRPGLAGAIDGKVSADGLRYMVRTPSNYDPTFAHPLLMVYAPAGQSRWVSERLTGLTTAATGAGFVVVYVDHRQLNIAAIEQLGAIPDLVAKEWCIDEKRVYVTGHSDGGTASLALAVLDKTRKIPAAIAPSAAGGAGDRSREGGGCPSDPGLSLSADGFADCRCKNRKSREREERAISLADRNGQCSQKSRRMWKPPASAHRAWVVIRLQQSCCGYEILSSYAELRVSCRL